MLLIKNRVKQLALNLFLSFFHAFFTGSLLFYSAISLASPEQVSIQLKWKHSFQFAGYYAAIEKGFYRDAGLEVTLKEIDYSHDFIEQVIAGDSEYGVSDSSLLSYHLTGRPVILLNQFFQHSPLVLLSLRDSGIVSPYEMVGKTILSNITSQSDAPLNAMLLSTVGDLSIIKQKPVNQLGYQDFIDGKIDVISAYSSSQPYLLKQQGIEVNIINPQSYGIDYYGDNLYTTAKELQEHPERVEKMSQASIKGWQYALDHPDEIIQLIRDKYAPALTEEYLQYEVHRIRQMILPNLIELGSVDPKRYQQVAEDYLRLGHTKTSQIKNHFFYKYPDQSAIAVKLTAAEKIWLKKHSVIRVSAEKDWPPFDFVDKNGQVQGITIDYWRLIGKQLGIRIAFESEGSWAERQEKLQRQELDAVGAISQTAARDKFLNFTHPYLRAPTVVASRINDTALTLEEMETGPIAVEKGYITATFLAEQYPDLELMLMDNTS